MIVVKLGGSLYNTPELTAWLTTLADFSVRTPIVIVPGGGPFADQVRVAQQLHHLDDSTAHQMALLAMKQFGLLLTALEPQCQPLYNDNVITPLSIWLPNESLLTEPALTASWDISSDSIALWLATKLNAEQLLLIKCIKPQTESIEQLALENSIDHGFAKLFSDKPINSQIVYYQDYSKLSDHINTPVTLTLP